MNNKKGFTLIELLVVIAIIALLLSILMPSLAAVKKKAQSVVCKSNVKQWAVCYALYASENDQSFPLFIGGTYATTYMESLREYYDNVNNLRTCPSATKVDTVITNRTGSAGQTLSFWGHTLNAWQIDVTNATWMDNDDWGIGSYCENSWLRSGGTNAKSWKKLSSVKYDVPMIGDGKWNNAWPDDNNTIPVVNPADNTNTLYSLSNWSTINSYVMRRHKDGLNMAFADMSARYLDAEELWQLEWNQQYDSTIGVDLTDLQ